MSTPENLLSERAREVLPQHVAIIMDGNGRWANQRRLPRTVGHRRGMEALRSVLRMASQLGIRYLTVIG
jgi:undecaprenyl diphosphate synthase